MRLDKGDNHFRLHRPLTQLTKVYVEPTVSCNLDCITCFRNEWDQPLGRMQDATFASVLEGLQQMDPQAFGLFRGDRGTAFSSEHIGLDRTGQSAWGESGTDHQRDDSE